MLLPLAAILWQSAGGGWHAFWLAVTSNAALESFRVTLTDLDSASRVINLVFGLLVAWVLTRDDFPGKRLRRRGDRPAVRAADHRRQPGDAARSTARTARSDLHLQHTKWGVGIALLFVDAAVRRALGAAGAAGTRPRGRGGRGVAGRQQLDHLHPRDPACALLPSLLSGAGLAFSRAIGEFGSVVLIGGAVPGETEVSSQWIRTLIENDDRTGAAAISIVLLVISFVVLFILRSHRLAGGQA